MEQTKKQKSTAVKIAIALAVVVSVAILSTLVQHWVVGRANIAVTLPVIMVAGFSIWRALWGNSK